MHEHQKMSFAALHIKNSWCDDRAVYIITKSYPNIVDQPRVNDITMNKCVLENTPRRLELYFQADPVQATLIKSVWNFGYRNHDIVVLNAGMLKQN